MEPCSIKPTLIRLPQVTRTYAFLYFELLDSFSSLNRATWWKLQSATLKAIIFWVLCPVPPAECGHLRKNCQLFLLRCTESEAQWSHYLWISDSYFARLVSLPKTIRELLNWADSIAVWEIGNAEKDRAAIAVGNLHLE